MIFISELIKLPLFLNNTSSNNNNASLKSTQSCSTVCEGSAQSCSSIKEMCKICETFCEGNCEAYCETNCQTGCEVNCTANCQINCTTNCEDSCTTQCEISCESPCQDNCTASQSCGSAQGCDNCENTTMGCGICQLNVQCGSGECNSQTCSQSCNESCSQSCSQSGSKPSNPTTYPRAIEKATTHIILEIDACSGATSYTLYYRKVETSSWSSISSTNTTITVNNLTPGTSYEFKYTAQNSYGTTADSYTSTATTQIQNVPPPAPTAAPSINNITYNSITVKITQIPTSTSHKVYYKISGASAWQNVSLSANTNTITIDNLKSSTTYNFTYSAVNNYGESAKSPQSNATTAPIPLELWAWSFSTSAGSDFNLSSSEWISFVDRINAVRVAKGLSEYSFTKNSTYLGSGKPFYAWIFAQATTALDDMNCGVSSQLKDVNYIASGKNIYGWYFTNLAAALNNAINSI